MEKTQRSEDRSLTFAKLRQRGFQNRKLADKKLAAESTENRHRGAYSSHYWSFAHDLASVIVA